MNRKVNLSQISLDELLYSVNKDLSQIDNYRSEDWWCIGGVLLDELEGKRTNRLARLNELMNNIDLALILDEFLPDANFNRRLLGHCDRSKKLIDLNAILFGQELIDDVYVIKHSFRNDSLINGLLQRNMDFEEIRLNFIFDNISAITCEEKMQVMLFTLPFRLNINDPISREIIDLIILENIKGKIELRENNKNEPSRPVVSEIYSLLNKLYYRANDITNNEKYILQQLVFMYIGRNDLVDQIYDIFSSNSLDNERVEFSYLYAINFVRKMRKFEISNPEAYLDIIEICDRYCEISLGNTEKLLDFNDKSIEIEYKPNYLISSEDKERMLISENELALCDKASNSQMIYMIKKVENHIEIKMLDLRFVHLKSLIFNRYIHDFGCLTNENITDSKKKLENIYLPLAKNFDHDYYVAIAADYAYLLALDESDLNYSNNLSLARDIMANLKIYSSSQKDIYWDYVRNYIFGYIYYKLSNCGRDNSKRDEIELAKSYFIKSLNEIPKQAKYLIKVVTDLVKRCK